MSTISILDYNAKNDGSTNNAPFIQAAIDACHERGGGRLVIPAGGVFVSGTIELKDGVELYLENGSMLQASHREADYKLMSTAGEYGGNEGGFLIQAKNARNISIAGNGTIDGQAEAFIDGWWTDDGEYIKKPKRFRSRIIGLFSCRQIRISNLTIQNSAQWTCHLMGCEDVVVHAITILNGLDVPNCDGIDPDHCRNVRISDCHIEAGDDGIAIKTTRDFREYGPSENITITGCTIVSTSAAIKIGSETENDIRDVVVTGCIIRRSHRGLAIQLRDRGVVENILFTDCVVETRQFHPKYWGNGEAIYITAVRRHDDKEVGITRNIVCRNILFRGENGVFICGSEDARIGNVILDGVNGTISKTSRFPVDYHDLRPRHSQEHGGLVRGALSGITAYHVDGLVIRRSSICFEGEERHHWHHALSAKSVEPIDIEDFDGSAADPGKHDAICLG